MKTILDLGMKLRVAYNHDRELIGRLKEYREYVDSVYIASNIKIFPTSGALVKEAVDWDRYDEEAGWVIRELKESGIKTYLLLNATNFDPEIVRGYERSELRKYLRKMVKEYGLEKAVIFSIPLAQRIKEDLPELGLEVSITAGVDSLEKARYWQDAVDIEGICLHHRLNKKVDKIKLIKERTGLRLAVIANDQCLVECPNELCHDNFATYRGHSISVYDCFFMTVLKPWDVFHQAKIVPANLKYYKGILDIVKLEGRSNTTSKTINQIINYSTNLNSYEYPDNAYRPLAYPFYHPYSIKQEPASVFGMVSKCKNDCDNCGYCEKTWLEYYGFTKDVYYCINGYREFHKKRYKEAIESFEKYLSSRNKTDGSLYYHLGLCYRYVNDVEKAISAMEKAVRLNISEWILFNFLGSLYRDKGNFSAAEKSLLEAIRLQPDEWSNYNVLGNIYSLLHRREEALKMYEKALSFNPEEGYAGRILENISRIKGAP